MNNFKKHFTKATKLFIILVVFISSTVTSFAEENSIMNTAYTIDVNCTLNQIVVYTTDEGNGKIPVKSFICSVGDATPDGVYNTTDKYVWRALFGNVYGQYATRITGHILFHSVPYTQMNKSTLEYEEYNKLGTTASMGCIRLTVEDAKWIYDNCPSGTEVMIYRSDEPMLLERPEAILIDISDEAKRSWDPTDPDPNNPWIEFRNQQKLSEDSEIDSEQILLSGIKTEQNEIQEMISKAAHMKLYQMGIRYMFAVNIAAFFPFL